MTNQFLNRANQLIALGQALRNPSTTVGQLIQLSAECGLVMNVGKLQKPAVKQGAKPCA